MKIVELIYEDLTHLGGSMGTEYTTEHSLGLFTGNDAVEKAKKAAEKNYRGDEKIKWVNRYRSDDLGYVMYHIRVRKTD